MTGLLYQSIDITISYLNYEVQIETFVGNPTKFYSPSLSICFDWIEMRRQNLFPNYSLCSGEKFNYNDCFQTIAKMKVNEMLNYTHLLQYFIREVIAYSPEKRINENMTQIYLKGRQK